MLPQPLCANRSTVVAGAASNGTSNGAATASSAETIPVTELRRLCEDALATLGYSDEEKRIKAEVSPSPLHRHHYFHQIEYWLTSCFLGTARHTILLQRLVYQNQEESEM
jgi:hypothetical protein